MKQLSISTHFTTGAIEEIAIKGDQTNFRWTRKYFGLPNGLNFLSEKKEDENSTTLTYEYFNGLILNVVRSVSDDEVRERYTLSNPTEKAVELDENYSIGLTFADDLDIAQVALKRRAYTRIFSGGNSLAIYNSKVNGDGEGVGVVLVDGVVGKVKETRISKRSLGIYDVEFACRSLNPKDEYSFEWTLFAFGNVDEFVSIVRKYQPFPTFSNYPILKGESVCIDCEDELFVDGIKIENRNITLVNPLLIKAERGDKIYEFILNPHSEEDYAKKLFIESFHQKGKYLEMLEKATQNPDNAKDILIGYFKKKNKMYFDINMPIEIIKSDNELKELFLRKAEYALLSEKSFYYPYQTLAKYDYLKKAYSINPDIRYLDKINELEKLRTAIFRLWNC